MDKELQRVISLTELAPSPYFFITNFYLVAIKGFAKFYEIPSLPVQVIKEKPKSHRLRNTKGNNSKRIDPSPYFSIINVHLVDINVFAKFYEFPSLPFQDIGKPKYRTADVKTVYLPHPQPHKHCLCRVQQKIAVIILKFEQWGLT